MSTTHAVTITLSASPFPSPSDTHDVAAAFHNKVHIIQQYQQQPQHRPYHVIHDPVFGSSFSSRSPPTTSRTTTSAAAATSHGQVRRHPEVRRSTSYLKLPLTATTTTTGEGESRQRGRTRPKSDSLSMANVNANSNANADLNAALQPLSPPSTPGPMPTSCSLCGNSSSNSNSSRASRHKSPGVIMNANTTQRPCGHHFCDSCCLTYLSSAQHCPVRFCQSEVKDAERLICRMKSHRRAADLALQSLPRTISPITSISSPNSGEIKYIESNVVAALSRAHKFLSLDGRCSLQPKELALIDTNIIGPHLIAFGNLYPSFLYHLDDGFTDLQARHWHHIIPALGKVFDNQEGFAAEVETGPLRALLQTNLDRALRKEGIDLRESRFIAQESLSLAAQRDLNVLSDYIMLICQEAYVQKIENERRNRSKSWTSSSVSSMSPSSTASGAAAAGGGGSGSGANAKHASVSRDSLSLHGVVLSYVGAKI